MSQTREAQRGIFMTGKGSKLEMGQSLSAGDWLTSDNNCFRAIMQTDGHFVVYQRTEAGEDCLWASGVWPGSEKGPYTAVMQSDGNFVVYQRDHSPIWASGVWPGSEKGPYTAVMQDDGNFVVYQKERHPLWATNTYWELAQVELSNISYDFDHLIVKDRPDLLSEATRVQLTNSLDTEQMLTSSLEYEYIETDSWTNGLDLHAGVEMKIQAGLPCFAHGRVGVISGRAYHFTSEKQRSTVKRYSTSISCKVPPHSQVICSASHATIQITLPYSAEVIYSLKNGKRLRGKLKGEYQGTKAYETQISWSNKNKEIFPF
jgi:hypothetical protein